MLSGTYYAKNYAGIIGRGLAICHNFLQSTTGQTLHWIAS